MGHPETSQRLPVVFLPGAGQDGEIWAEVVPLVAQPVIVHEFPAHGGRFGSPLERVEDLAEDVLDHLPGRAAVLVGHSLGGAVALEAALRRPKSVSGVVVICTQLDHKPDRRATAALEEGDLDRFADLIHLGIVGLQGPSEAAEASARRLERVVRRTAAHAIAADYRAVASHDLTGRLRGLQLPVAVIAGGRDVLVPPRRVAGLAAELEVEAVVVAEASHQVPWEAPEVVADTVRQLRAEAGV